MLSSKLNLPKLRQTLSKITKTFAEKQQITKLLNGSMAVRDAEVKRLAAVQTGKIKEFRRKGDVGLVNDPADNLPHLVQAGTGIRILGMDGVPIKDMSHITPNAVPFPIGAMVSLLAGPDFENNREHMYLDSGGLVTAGIGHKMSSEAKALTAHRTLQFTVKATGAPATDADVKADFNLLWNNRSKYANFVAGAFKNIVSLKFPPGNARTLAEIDVNKKLGQLQSGTPFPKDEFDSWPEGVQMALVDIVFNIGKQKFINEFKILPVALLHRDWKSAQPQSSRRGIPAKRNTAVGALFDQAIMTEKFYISIAKADEKERLIFQTDGMLKQITI